MNAPITAATTPLTDAQAERLQTLVGELTPTQLLWLSGYLAARAQFGGEGPIARAASGASTLTVLYGSQSGNGARLARRLAELAQARGLRLDASQAQDIGLGCARCHRQNCRQRSLPPRGATLRFDAMTRATVPFVFGAS